MAAIIIGLLREGSFTFTVSTEMSRRHTIKNVGGQILRGFLGNLLQRGLCENIKRPETDHF
jgi:hypothetical protein